MNQLIDCIDIGRDLFHFFLVNILMPSLVLEKMHRHSSLICIDRPNLALHSSRM